MILEGLRTLLLAQTSVQEIVSHDGQSGVYVTWARQSATPPYIVIDQYDDDHNLTLGNTPADSDQLIFAEITIECWHRTPSKAIALSKIVREFLDDYTGAAGDETIEAVLFDGERIDNEAPESGKDADRFVCELEFIIQYRP